MAFEKGHKVSGSRKGIANKSTTDARVAISKFVDGNAHKLQSWLDQIAEGKIDKDTKEVLINPNPQKAFELFQSVIEYHIPKLARTDTTIEGEVKFNININYPNGHKPTA